MFELHSAGNGDPVEFFRRKLLIGIFSNLMKFFLVLMKFLSIVNIRRKKGGFYLKHLENYKALFN